MSAKMPSSQRAQSAKDLIRANAKVGAPTRPSPEILTELRELIDHNDSIGSYKGVGYISADKAIAWLNERGFQIRSRCKFDKIIRESFGRTWCK